MIRIYPITFMLLINFFVYLLKCTFEKVELLRYALRDHHPRLFTQRAGRFPVGPEPDMSLLSDDEPERNLLAEAFPLDEEFLPALSGPDAPVNPARA